MLVDGNPLAVRGVNVVGLRRRDFSAGAASRRSSRCTGCCTAQGKTLDEARAAIADAGGQQPEAAADVR